MAPLPSFCELCDVSAALTKQSLLRPLLLLFGFLQAGFRQLMELCLLCAHVCASEKGQRTKLDMAILSALTASLHLLFLMHFDSLQKMLC